MKKLNIRNHYKFLTNKLIKTQPGKFFGAVKEICGQKIDEDYEIPEFQNLSNEQAAEVIAQHFSRISNQYNPIDRSSLPHFLPDLPPPQVTQADVHKKLINLKNTKSTNPIDLPSKLRNEYNIYLLLPITDIINTCLQQQVYPDKWKIELVTPMPKVPPKQLKDLRKIACTSDFSKLFESFLKDWILDDIGEKN